MKSITLFVFVLSGPVVARDMTQTRVVEPGIAKSGRTVSDVSG